MDPDGAIITINALAGGHPLRPHNAIVRHQNLKLFENSIIFVSDKPAK